LYFQRLCILGHHGAIGIGFIIIIIIIVSIRAESKAP